MKVKLIFNPKSGANSLSAAQLIEVTKEMQAWKLVPEIFLIEHDCDLKAVINDAIANGIRMFVVCGGDGTISAVTRAMVGTKATLGIIPTGTQNNVALSLGIPNDIASAVAILRNGQPSKIDVGMVTCGEITEPFLEICSVGLLTNLYPAGDDIQHGDITRIGDFLTTLVTSPPSEISLFLEGNREIKEMGHIVVVSNMPYVGRNYQIGNIDSFNDGLLDVLFFADLSKLDILGYVIKGRGTNDTKDPRIQHYQVCKVMINTKPNMPVMADGISMGEGLVQIEVRRKGLTVMVKSKVTNQLANDGEDIGK